MEHDKTTKQWDNTVKYEENEQYNILQIYFFYELILKQICLHVF